ncbi:MAG: AAA family ATPase [Ignavibacteriaceae bacterium]|nr:AAA family ATPase [Ignavibacteriaceae bacterium]
MARIVSFFNNKGGVGKTTLVYHTAWMMSELGYKVLVVDLDPQSNLTSAFLSAERMEEIYSDETSELTILNSLKPVIEAEPFISSHVEKISENISLIAGDLALSAVEDNLSDAWTKCLNGDVYAFKVTSIFNSIIEDSVSRINQDLVLVDIGPNLGALNRSVLITTDFIVIPVAPDLFSLQGLKNIGETLTKWLKEWAELIRKKPKQLQINVPAKEMKAAGYVILQHSARENRPVKAYLKWTQRIPEVYHSRVLKDERHPESIEVDESCLGLLKHYHSLAPMAMEARKPMFLLKPGDGAIGAHMTAVLKCYDDFKILTEKVLSTCGEVKIK